LERGKTSYKVLIGIVVALFVLIVTSAQPNPSVGTDGLPPTTAGGSTGEVLGPPTAGGTATGSTSTSSTATGSTSTTSTAGTTGVTSGDGNGYGVGQVVLKKIEEKLYAPSRYLSGGVLVSPVDSRHVVRLKLECPYTYSSDPVTGASLMTYVGAIGVPVGTELGSDTTLPTITKQTINPVGGGSSVDCAVVQGPSAPSSTWNAWVQRGSTATLTGGTVTFYIRYITHTETPVSPPTIPPTTTPTSTDDWYKIDLVVDKLALTSISLDSRKVYGKANLDGELPGDPNAEAGNNNFQPWVFRGGLFVGNMPYSSAKDQSGTARLQLQLTNSGDEDTYIMSCLSLFSTGIRGSVSPGTIGLFRPSSSDTNLSQGLNAHWGNKWGAIEPGGTQSGPGDFTKAPFYTVAPNTTKATAQTHDQFNYLNWQMPSVSYVWQTAYGGDGNSAHNKMWTHFALCQSSESAHAWQYFGSEWIESVSGQQFPLTDSRPRVWKVRYP
jgi:hypothetical protein